jgi:hypothetical protein
MTIWPQQQHQSVSTIETRKGTNLLILLFPATAWLLVFVIICYQAESLDSGSQ